jgi:hypothetical protein
MMATAQAESISSDNMKESKSVMMKRAIGG